MGKRIIGESPAVKTLMNLIQRVAPTKTNVLIIGESGTGKELVARMIHDSGPFKDKPFVPVNCGAIPENLIESEMFGHRRGSFTGAVSDKVGLFEAANGGSLFLDEVGELPLGLQVKLLRALQERIIRRVGGTDDIRVDVRVIAATNRDLEAAVARGTFREDLYYRLNVILIRTPPLRERKTDIVMLAQHFLKRFNTRFGKTLDGFEDDVIELFMEYAWPGNIRELENTIERAATLENSETISRHALPSSVLAAAKTAGGARSAAGAKNGASIGSSLSSSASDEEIRLPAPDFTQGPIDLDQILGQVEASYLTRALEHTGGVKKHAAEMLGITFRSMRYRLKKLGVGDAGDDEE